MEFERRITFSPAFDRRDPDPKKNYGIHGVELRMVLLGELGATQFLLYTNWHLPHLMDAWAKQPCERTQYGNECVAVSVLLRPLPADLGYHWSTQRYGSQEMMECDLLPGGKCFYDGSGLNAERGFQRLVAEGDQAVWQELEKFYQELVTEEIHATD